MLYVNVTATLGVDLPTNSSQEDISAELAVKNLSADDAIDMLASEPDRFLGRTTKVPALPCCRCTPPPPPPAWKGKPGNTQRVPGAEGLSHSPSPSGLCFEI